jgi:predicted SpoU family rRNA methylase
MTNLEYGPQYFMSLLSVVRRILGIFHFVAKLQESVFDVVEACGGRFCVTGCADWRHFAIFFSFG